MALGEVRELRYVRETVWPSNWSAGLGLAFLPQCHADCPQSVAHVTYIDEGWRRILANGSAEAEASADAEGGEPRCEREEPALGAAGVVGG